MKAPLPRWTGIVATAITSAWLLLSAPPAMAWDSDHFPNYSHPTHTYLTEWALDQTPSPDFQRYRQTIIEGANTELHELPVSGTQYGVDLNAKRLQHRGTNAGCDDIKGWWDDCVSAYQGGDRAKAYFLLGVLLHMVEDMGVPAHANGVYHQGNLTEFDNFEFLALNNWKPKFDAINRHDPGYSEPWRYYAFSQDWAHTDAPDYHDRNSFAKFWLTASAGERALLQNRQGRTAHVVLWTLNSAARSLGVSSNRSVEFYSPAAQAASVALAREIITPLQTGTLSEAEVGRPQKGSILGGASSLHFFNTSLLKSSDVDLTDHANEVVTLEPGHEYELQWAAGTALDMKWAAWGTGPFEVQVRGVSIWGFLPNPFNSDWMPAKGNWAGDKWGINGEHKIITFSLWARSRSTVKVRSTQQFTGTGGIDIHF